MLVDSDRMHHELTQGQQRVDQPPSSHCADEVPHHYLVIACGHVCGFDEEPLQVDSQEGGGDRGQEKSEPGGELVEDHIGCEQDISDCIEDPVSCLPIVAKGHIRANDPKEQHDQVVDNELRVFVRERVDGKGKLRGN